MRKKMPDANSDSESAIHNGMGLHRDQAGF